MGTTLDRAAVGRHTLAQALTELMLDSRDSLPHARNGRPGAPSDPRAAQVRKDIGQLRANPFGQILTVLECDVRDQVPVADVVAPLRQLIAHLEVIGVAGHRTIERPIVTLIRAETKAQCRADLAELRVAEHPDDATALAEAIREVEGHEQALVAVKHACVQRLAVVRVASRPVHGVRRPLLAVR